MCTTLFSPGKDTQSYRVETQSEQGSRLYLNDGRWTMDDEQLTMNDER